MEHLVFSVLNEVQQHLHPVAIYGAGNLAKKIYRFLFRNGANIDAFVVDKAYFPSKEKKVYDVNVMAIDDFVELYDKPEIIVGFEGRYEDNLNKDIIKKIYKIHVADFLGFLALEENNYITEEYYHQNELWFSEFACNLQDKKSVKAWQSFIEQKMKGTIKCEYDETGQYFDNLVIGNYITGDEVFVDCGGFHGETVEAFIDFLHNKGIYSWSHIYSIEPDYKNAHYMYNKLKSVKKLDIIEAGIYKDSGKMLFADSRESSSMISEKGGKEIDVISLDDYMEGNRVTFIKMDIEGSELMALKGASKTICRYKPKLAVCIYHKKEDLVEIPQYIMSLDLNYKFYVRNYSMYGVETVLYAV